MLCYRACSLSTLPKVDDSLSWKDEAARSSIDQCLRLLRRGSMVNCSHFKQAVLSSIDQFLQMDYKTKIRDGNNVCQLADVVARIWCRG